MSRVKREAPLGECMVKLAVAAKTIRKGFVNNRPRGVCKGKGRSEAAWRCICRNDNVYLTHKPGPPLPSAVHPSRRRRRHTLYIYTYKGIAAARFTLAIVYAGSQEADLASDIQVS